MSFASFIASRISFKSKRTFSKLIVRIAIAGISLGLGVMILSLAIIRGFKAQILENVRGFDGDITVIKYDLNVSYENSPFVKADTFENKMRHSRDIEYLAPFATKPGIIRANNEIEGVLLKGVDKTYNWSFLKNSLVEGRVIDFSDTTRSKQELIITKTLANRLKLKLGDNIMMYFVQQPLRRRPFKVVGIFATSIEDIDKIYVIGDIALIRRLNDWRADEIGGYEIRVNDFSKIENAGHFIDNNLPPRLKFTTVFENFPVIFEWLPLLDVNARVMLVLMLAVAVINMISALLIMILERTPMIGIFKAMGATNWSIQRIFLYNSTLIIGIGLILGNVLGLGLGLIQYNTHFFKLDASSYYMPFVPIKLTWYDVIGLNIGTMLICLLVLLIPSMIVSKISPVKTIRFK